MLKDLYKPRAYIRDFTVYHNTPYLLFVRLSVPLFSRQLLIRLGWDLTWVFLKAQESKQDGFCCVLNCAKICIIMRKIWIFSLLYLWILNQRFKKLRVCKVLVKLYNCRSLVLGIIFILFCIELWLSTTSQYHNSLCVCLSVFCFNFS